MFRNYLRVAWRNLWKSKIFSAINIAGLAIGMAACIIIMLFVSYEKSFDGFHSKNIYRLNEVQKFEGMVEPQNVALSMFPMGPTLKNEFPEIRSFTRVNDADRVTVEHAGKRIVIPLMHWVDSNFLEIFDFKLLKGEKQLVLQKPNSVVFTEETVAKIFGKDDAIGKSITYFGRDTMTFVVTGILQNIPANSHLQFDGLFSLNTVVDAEDMENWGSNWLITYLDIDKNANIGELEKKFPGYLRKHMTDENWKNYQLFIQPLKEVHANSVNITHDYLNFQKFDKKLTYIFSVIAFIVLIIACINFMNLSTAKSAARAKEVGVRKSIGAQRFQLAIQFIGESVLLSFIALILALLLVQVFLPYVVGLSQRELKLFSNPEIFFFILVGTVLVGFVSGLYPAAYLSSFRASRVLKGSVQTGKNKGGFRNILVVTQFTSAVFLIIATVYAVKQLNYMQSKDPGFNREQVMIIPVNRQANARYNALKQEFLKNNLVAAVTASQQRLGNNLHQTSVHFYNDTAMRELTSSQVIVDPDYLSLYKIPLIAGRNFSKDVNENGRAYIINETLAKELLKDKPGASIESLIGKRFGFSWADSATEIVGVAKDFNFNSLHHKIETLCILNQKEWGFSEMSVRINGEKAEEAIVHIQSAWKKMLPEHPFEYSFLDEHFARLYRADMQTGKIVGILAMLAIIISCLGLFGLAAYSAEKRIKEIGIRKVLGATVQNVVSLLSKDFIKLVLIANFIAWPLAWFSLNKWLQDFAYRINISWWVFLAAGSAALLIAMLTLSSLAIKAAVANPVKSLRTE
jgi:putative ABC transport system permease protein